MQEPEGLKLQILHAEDPQKKRQDLVGGARPFLVAHRAGAGEAPEPPSWEMGDCGFRPWVLGFWLLALGYGAYGALVL